MSKNILAPALRQYRHNNNDNGFVFGYDKEEVDSIVAKLEDENKKLRELMKGWDAYGWRNGEYIDDVQEFFDINFEQQDD